MTQKESYRQAEAFATAQGWEIIPDQITGRKYAFCVMNNENCIQRHISGYLKPADLLLFIDGYNAGMQARQ